MAVFVLANGHREARTVPAGAIISAESLTQSNIRAWEFCERIRVRDDCEEGPLIAICPQNSVA
jgi:hypothetical protein